MADTLKFSDTPMSHGQWQGYRTRKAVAWLLDANLENWEARPE